MKRPIFILSSLLCIYGISPVIASDSLEDTLVEEEFVEETPAVDNIQISDAKYMRDTMDEIEQTRVRVNELLVPKKSLKNLWTDDTVTTGDVSIQSVVMTPMERPTVSFSKAGKYKAQHSGFSLGEQSYYGETVYIINNFLSGSGDNVSETTENYNGKYSDEVFASTKSKTEYKDCPFDTVAECAVWLRKPIVSETVAPRSKVLRDGVMCDITSAIEANPNISANDKSMAPLLNRYKVLMRASQSCCTGGITYKLKQAGASKGLIYKFLSDDANFSGFGSRCVVMTDEEIHNTKKFEATSAMISDVRNSCICKSKTTIKALLAPFEQLYKEYPQFADAPFEYRHHDGVGRPVTDFVNADVQNVLNQLEMCP